MLQRVFHTSLILLASFSTLSASDNAASSYDVSGLLENNQVVGPPDVFHLTPGGVQILRGLPVATDVTGDLVGTLVLDQDSNWNAQGNGGIHGAIFFDVSWGGMNGTFQGEGAGNVKGFFVTSSSVLEGAGDFEGYKLQVTFEGFLGDVLSYTGRLIDPNAQN